MAAPSYSLGQWPRVSVVIPTLNEERNLPHVLSALPSDIYEVIVVDGHSVDDTLAVARKLRPDARIVMQTRSGKGNALACGCVAATGDIIAMIDADGSTDTSEIASFVLALLDGADFAKGTRFAKGGGSEDITRMRALGNRMLTGMVNLLYGTKYTDLCYGFNVFWKSHLSVLGFDTTAILSADGSGCLWGDGFEIETLINIRIAAAGLAVAEVPSFERSRIYGVSNLSAFSDGIRVFRTILHERFIVPRQGRRFPDRRLLTRMSGAPGHRQVDVAGRSWAGSDSSVGLNGDGPRSAVRQPRLADLGVEPAPEAQAGKLSNDSSCGAAACGDDSRQSGLANLCTGRGTSNRRTS
jgi:glycosyltransferase involved in cell wall biosynthesis